MAPPKITNDNVIKKTKASGDVKTLQQLVDISANLKSTRWKMFGTPEYDGGVPGPY
jgi:hypothetical protein